MGIVHALASIRSVKYKHLISNTTHTKLGSQSNIKPALEEQAAEGN